MLNSFEHFSNRFDLWIMILCTSLVFATFKSGLLMIFHKLKISNIFGFIWTSLNVYFGGKPSNTSIDSRRTYKAVVFVSLLSGVIIWMAYRSFLTAELSVIIKKYPFNDLESLSKTNWRYLIIFKNYSTTYEFQSTSHSSG